MSLNKEFFNKIIKFFNKKIISHSDDYNEFSIIIDSSNLIEIMIKLKKNFNFEQLIDILGVDYLTYGIDEWTKNESTYLGFSRAVKNINNTKIKNSKKRFSAIYHLLSLTHNFRLRVQIFLNKNNLLLPTLVPVWPSANWNEREVFDMFGFIFYEHPDLRRILTDYGFLGHPLRKDFPQSGHLEVHYDEKDKRVVYGSVEIDPRINTPKIIRKDNRYLKEN